jgi:hypothetical protein
MPARSRPSDLRPLLDLLAGESRRSRVANQAALPWFAQRGERGDANGHTEALGAPASEESSSIQRRADNDHFPSPVGVSSSRERETSAIKHSLAAALRIEIENRREQRHSIAAAIHARAGKPLHTIGSETPRRHIPSLAMAALSEPIVRPNADLRSQDFPASSRSPRDVPSQRELVAKIELDDERLAEETSTRLAEELAAREQSLVERIERLVERKLDGLRRNQLQRHRSIEALVRFE